MSQIKTLFIVCLQFIVVVTLWVVVYIESTLTRSMMYLSGLTGSLLSPRSSSVLEKIVDGRQKGRPKKTDEEIVNNVLGLLDRTDNDSDLNNDREVFENTEDGRRVRAEHSDRHLYAILRPTRSENLKRIENVLQAMSPDALQRIRECM